MGPLRVSQKPKGPKQGGGKRRLPGVKDRGAVRVKAPWKVGQVETAGEGLAVPPEGVRGE